MLAPSRVRLGVCLLAVCAGLAVGDAARGWAQGDERPEGSLADDQIVRDQWTIRDGLPLNHANALLQTPDGYLWLATFDGLVRFDGVRFTVFHAGNTTELSSNRFIGLFPGIDGAFWAVGEQGLVHIRDGAFREMGHTANAGVVVDGDSVQWVRSEEGLFRYEGGMLRPAVDHLFGGHYVTRLLRARDGALWVAVQREVGRAELWRLGERPQRFDYPNRGLVYALAEDADGTIWAGGRGLARLEGGAFQTVDALAPARFVPQTTRHRLSHTDPYLFQLRAAGDGVWAATHWGLYRTDETTAEALVSSSDSGGFEVGRYRYDHFATCPDGRSWMTHQGRFFRNGRLAFEADVVVTDLLCDREGSLWVTTNGQGLRRFREPLLHTVGAEEGLGFRNVVGLFEDEQGGLWAGTIGHRYARVAGGTVARRTLPRSPDGAGAGAAGVGWVARDGTLWIGRSRCRPNDRLPAGCRRFEHLGAVGSRGDIVRAVLETRDGAVWIGHNSGVSRFRKGRWTHFRGGTPSAPGLPHAMVRFLAETADGTLYLATFGHGLARFVPEGAGGRFERLTTADGLSSDNVRWIHEDVDGALWIATEDRGLNHFDPATGIITPIRAADGLYDDNLHSLLDDGHGRFWFSTNRGLFWIRAAALRALVRGEAQRVQSVAYTERDGMRNREANGGFQTSALRARDGRLWFATQQGLVVVDPAEVQAGDRSPPVVIEAVEVRGRPVEASPEGGVALPASARDFTVRYTGLSFAAPERLRFRYRLDGFSDGWVEVGGRREAVFTNVPPGTYTFRVAASHGDGVWSPVGTALTLGVAPFVWETWWFRLLTALALAAALGVGLWWRLRQSARREAALQALVVERTEALAFEHRRTEVALFEAEGARREAERAAATIEAQRRELATLDEAKTRFFTNVSHEFRTPLTLTIGPLEDLRQGRHGEMPAPARAVVETALHNSRRLLRLINQLLDVARLEAGEFRLRRRALDLRPLVDVVTLAFTPLAERRRLTFTIDLPDTPVPARVDEDAFEQIIVNLLSNAFKFTPVGGAVVVTLAAEGEWARLAVADDGPGIPPEVQPYLFERFFQVGEAASDLQAGSGIGLALARELAVLHGGTLTVESEVGRGSRFEVALPLHRGAHETAAPRRPSVPDGRAEESDGELAPAGDGGDRTTVLVVDDNAEIRRYVRGHLEDSYRVIEAADGHAGLEAARRHLPDCIVSDVMMPGLDGFALLRALRDDPEVDFLPVVLLTARAAPDDRIGGLERGADDYLTKPFDAHELRARVANLIASRRRLRERFAREGGPPSLPPLPDAAWSAADAAFVEEVRAAVEAALHDEDFSVDALAEAVGQSRSTLYRRLQALIDETPNALIRRLRLERAAALLAEHQGTIGEVAYAVGFKSVSHFSQCFRKHFDLSPSAYRDRVPVT